MQRAKAEQTQEDLAFAAGFDRTFVIRLETGKRQHLLSVLVGPLSPEELFGAAIQDLPR